MNTILEPPSLEHLVALDDEQFVIRSVLDQLGRPRNLYRVDAKKVWDNQYRVNVYCAKATDGTIPTVNMTDSFLVGRTEEGISSRPAIERKY